MLDVRGEGEAAPARAARVQEGTAMRQARTPGAQASRQGGGAGPIAATCLALLCLAGAVLAPGAAAKERQAKVSVGAVRLAAPAGGGTALLVSVRYPVELSGRSIRARVSLLRRSGGTIRTWTARGRPRGGSSGTPVRKQRLTFVHRIDLGPKLAKRVRRSMRGGRAGLRVRVVARGALDVNGDGSVELASGHRVLRVLRRRAGPRHCTTVPQLRVSPGRPTAVRLPACGSAARWRIARPPQHGAATIRKGRLVYRSAGRFRGTESIVLKARPRGAAGSARGGAVAAPVQIKVAQSRKVIVRAIGDSVTAGFGYYDDGTEMSIGSLIGCRPGETAYNDACSSNSTNRSNKGTTVNYAPDYGLSNNVSWVAQWANEHGVTNYANFAVSGSEPSDWTQGGQLHETTKRLESEKPDYILMTMGANPLLANMLFGIDNMGCAIWADAVGKYRECVEEAFAKVSLNENLKRLYTELVENTNATIYLMQYHLSVPSVALAYTATQIALMGNLLNERIASVAAEVSPTRLKVVTPPHFFVGIDISPAYRSNYSCSKLGYQVDGQSVQSTPSQYELWLLHYLSFCAGPASGPPWVISGDTGIHPSTAGYAQMASQVPAPR